MESTPFLANRGFARLFRLRFEYLIDCEVRDTNGGL